MSNQAIPLTMPRIAEWARDPALALLSHPPASSRPSLSSRSCCPFPAAAQQCQVARDEGSGHRAGHRGPRTSLRRSLQGLRPRRKIPGANAAGDGYTRVLPVHETRGTGLPECRPNAKNMEASSIIGYVNVTFVPAVQCHAHRGNILYPPVTSFHPTSTAKSPFY